MTCKILTQPKKPWHTTHAAHLCPLTAACSSPTMRAAHHSPQQQEIRHMAQPLISQEELAQGLRRLGVQPGAIVEVHSSLSAFGRVVGGAPAVIDALIDVITPDGTIVMSA